MTSLYSTELEKCVIELHRIGAVKFGDFTLKSGIKSPIYFDLRTVISFPEVLSTVADLLWKVSERKDFDHLCGVPYTALPIATLISTKNALPMLIRRKEIKTYGTKKMIEGIFKEGQSCLLIEDVVVSGSSIIETANLLRREKLNVSEAIVFLDREQGGTHNLSSFNIKLTSVITIQGVLDILQRHEKVEQSLINKALEYLQSNSRVSVLKDLLPQPSKSNDEKRVNLSLLERAEMSPSPLTRRLLTLIQTKETNLCVAVDVKTSRELIAIADEVGPFICLLKTHIDVLSDFTADTVEALKGLAAKHNFLLFEDRKFADIGNTVKEQYCGGVYRIQDWAHLVTVHGIAGPGTVKGLTSCGGNGREDRGCVLVAEMSSAENLTSSSYVKGCVQIGKDHPEFVSGFVCQSQVSDDPGTLLFTPGVNITASGDSLGQQYISPEEAVLQRGADVVIVGRGITAQEEASPSEMARRYRDRCFASLLSRVEQKPL